MIPVAFVGAPLNANYLIEYLNVVFAEDINIPWDFTTFENGYALFFKDLDLELNKDIFIVDCDEIQNCNKEFEANNFVIGMPITNFPIELSIKRMCIDIHALLTSIDLLVQEPLELVEFMLFNMKENT